MSIKNQGLFPILLESGAISPAVINLSTCVPTNCLPLQNQTTNDEDKTPAKTILS
jgi:hypothetical protein